MTQAKLRSDRQLKWLRVFPVVLSFAFSGEPGQASTEFLQVETPRASGPIARAGGPIDGLTPEQIENFTTGLLFFSVPHSVKGTEPAAPVNGLGPTFNHSNCLACHSHPGPGGSSPPLNPLVEIATHFGARNIVPSFIRTDGPIREVRFRRKPDGSADGAVHQLYSISGRQDAEGCKIPQPNFAKEAKRNNLSFRIPTPIFGGGLIELISEVDIVENMNAYYSEKSKLGISGRVNRGNNTGTITRFGWKAQNPSLEVFAGEAYNVEQGITNDIFPAKRANDVSCNFNRQPEDTARFDVPLPFKGLSAVNAFTNFTKFLAPPQRGIETSSSRNGEKLFNQIGCALCHTPRFTTGPTVVSAFSNKPVNLFSDLLLHNMGPGLADHVSQGLAGPDEFRTAPLWGVGQRLFFLHDGRTSDLVTAIRTHASSGRSAQCKIGAEVDLETGVACHSEANEVIWAFDLLGASERQDIVNFLKTL